MDLRDTVALVTGGARRVGKAIVLELARAGAHVAFTYHTSTDAAQETLREVQALGVEGLAIPCDIRELAGVQAMVRQLVDRFGKVDILVNAADDFGRHPFPTQDYTTWHQVIQVGIHGTFYVSNELAPLLLSRPQAAVVNILDLCIWQPWRNFTAHAVVKAGLLALTQQMALELAPTVRVNGVAPGLVLPPDHLSPAQVARMGQRTLLQRWGRPEDVAGAVRFLAEADYITGEVLVVDGGERIAPRS